MLVSASEAHSPVRREVYTASPALWRGSGSLLARDWELFGTVTSDPRIPHKSHCHIF